MQENKEIKKYKVSFLDAEGIRTNVDIEFRDSEKGPEFSMSADYGESGGQCQD